MKSNAKSVLERNQTEPHQMFSDVSANTACKSKIIQTKCKNSTLCDRSPKQTKGVDTQIFLKHAPPAPGVPFQQTTHPTDPHDNDPTPHQLSHGGSNKCLGCCCFLVWLPRRLFSNLRTACSETLMLRERKASMADRSLSSLTGELLLLATAAAAFATLAARRLDGDENPCGRAGGTGPGWRYGGGGQ